MPVFLAMTWTQLKICHPEFNVETEATVFILVFYPIWLLETYAALEFI